MRVLDVAAGATVAKRLEGVASDPRPPECVPDPLSIRRPLLVPVERF